jgi:hypothetical protein
MPERLGNFAGPFCYLARDFQIRRRLILSADCDQKCSDQGIRGKIHVSAVGLDQHH